MLLIVPSSMLSSSISVMMDNHDELHMTHDVFSYRHSHTRQCIGMMTYAVVFMVHTTLRTLITVDIHATGYIRVHTYYHRQHA